MIYDGAAPDRSLCYKVYRDALVATGNSDLIKEFNLDNVVFNPELAKELSEYAKKKGKKCSRNWRYLVDLHRLCDYLEYKDVADFRPDIMYWVGEKKKHTWLGDESKFYSQFEKAVNTVLFRRGVSPNKVMSIDDWISNGDLWATAGSAFEPDEGKLTVLDKTINKDIDVKKNKWSMRWKLSNSKVKRLMFRRRKQMCKAVQKTETGKVRAVISSDMSTYLKMAYLSGVIDPILRGRTDSTLFMRERDRFDLWQKMGPDTSYRMPLDQSEFDQQVTLEQVLIVVRSLKKLVNHYYHGDKEQINELFDLVLYAIDGGTVMLGNERIAIVNGVLSGWRWTALIDTIVNLAEVEMSSNLIKEVTGERPKMLDMCAQGDDDWFKFKDYRSCVSVWAAFESFGLLVNPGKFFVDDERDEFLRRVCDKGVVTGYPARSVTSIMFRNPISAQEQVGLPRVRESLNKWRLFANRLDKRLDTNFFMESWLKDSIQSSQGLNRSMLLNWLYMDPVQGGAGYDEGIVKNAEIPGSTEVIKHNFSLNADGYTEWLQFGKNYGLEESDALRFAISTLDIPQHVGYPSWVRYIYTHDLLENSPVPFGTANNIPGTVCIGLASRKYAWSRRLKWFPTVARLVKSSYHDDLGAFIPEYYNYEKTGEVNQYAKNPLRVKGNISRTLANLSSSPEDVWVDAHLPMLKHKPKSWQRDFLSDRLKAPPPIVDGYGLDITGALSSSFLNSAITQALTRRRMTINYWKNLMRKIVGLTATLTRNLRVRVVE